MFTQVLTNIVTDLTDFRVDTNYIVDGAGPFTWPERYVTYRRVEDVFGNYFEVPFYLNVANGRHARLDIARGCTQNAFNIALPLITCCATVNLAASKSVFNRGLERGDTSLSPTIIKVTGGAFKADCSSTYVFLFVFSNNSSNYGNLTNSTKFYNYSINNGTLNSRAVFNGGSKNKGVCNSYATFNGSAQNLGTLQHSSPAQGQAEYVFRDSAQNKGQVLAGDCTFYNYTINSSTIYNNATFRDSAVNNGIVNNDTWFKESAINNGTVATATFFGCTVSNAKGTVTGALRWSNPSFLTIADIGKHGSLYIDDGVDGDVSIINIHGAVFQHINGQPFHSTWLAQNVGLNQYPGLGDHAGDFALDNAWVTSGVYFFYSTSNRSWYTLSNWYTNASHTTQAKHLPEAGSYVVVVDGSVQPYITLDNQSWAQPATINSGSIGIEFYSNATNHYNVSCNIIGTAKFSGYVTFNK